MNLHHDRVLRYFAWEHLPPALGDVSRPFGVLAANLADQARLDAWDPVETTIALRKLLEAKDAAVRAALDLGDRRGEIREHGVDVDPRAGQPAS
jgi:hypothetical protein